MNDDQVATVCAYVISNWPAAAMSTGTLDVYRMEMGALEFDEAIEALREDFAEADFPPPPMKLRAAVLRRQRAPITYEVAMAELLDRVASVGYASPEPAWSDPAITELVRLRGGWAEVCASTPARAAVNANGQGTFNTWAAQFREEFRVVAERATSVHTHAVLSAGLGVQVSLPGSRFDPALV